MSSHRQALILSGGGARGAYQVGVLKALAELVPKGHYPFDIITGVSVGALNAAVLATWPDDFHAGARSLEKIWRELSCNHVFRTDDLAMARNIAGWTGAALFGWLGVKPPRSLLDNSPLRQLIDRHIDFEKLNRLGGPGGLKAIAITASSYRSGRAVTYFATNRPTPEWGRARRIGVARPIRPEHVLASSALPIVFPAVSVSGVYFGDGALRENAPLSSAIRLGADDILTIAARDGKPDPQPIPNGDPIEPTPPYPTVGDMAGHMLDILFNDNAGADIENLRRLNGLLERLPPAERTKTGLRKVDYLAVEPSEDLRPIAGAHAKDLPRSVRLMLHLIGGMNEPWVLPSYLLFEAGYVGALIDLGYRDGMKNKMALKRLAKDP